jgi:hypothetical protein
MSEETHVDDPQIPSDTPGSVWSTLRDQHREVTENTDPLYIADPIHPGVVLRFRYVPLADTKGATKRIVKISDKVDQTLVSSIETILLSLEEIHVVSPDGEIPLGQNDRVLYDEKLKPLADEGEAPMQFDERVCAGMGFPAGTADKAAKIVREWFARKDYVIIQLAQEISAWFTQVGPGVRDEFEESLGKA